jgi:hypothetical protein
MVRSLFNLPLLQIHSPDSRAIRSSSMARECCLLVLERVAHPDVEGRSWKEEQTQQTHAWMSQK